MISSVNKLINNLTKKICLLPKILLVKSWGKLLETPDINYRNHLPRFWIFKRSL